MQLAALLVSNFRVIGATPVELRIDNIVALIGANNAGKSTLMEAYRRFATLGDPLTLSDFHNEKADVAVVIEAVFTGLTAEDIDTVGKSWVHEDDRYGPCIRVKVEWARPGVKGQKFSWDPENDTWVPGGMGGWDSLLQSRVPEPLYIGPEDKPEETEKRLLAILVDAAKKASEEHEELAEAYKSFRALADKIEQSVREDLDKACADVSDRLNDVFPGVRIAVRSGVGEVDASKLIGAGSHLRVAEASGIQIPLAQQGTGLRRAFLWAALRTVADLGASKARKTKKTASDRPRILLIEEPESYLHPPAVRAARDALYRFSELENWQVLVSTHSPVFIDVSKPHTTIIRVNRSSGTATQIYSTEKESFDENERERLAMIRACHPTVAEFFFADRVVLVEGDTEHAVLTQLLEEEPVPGVHVVNCMGKANVPLFARILNQFKTPYTAVHDADAPRARWKESWRTNAMWTVNSNILTSISKRDPGAEKARAVCHVPDFEGYYFGTEVSADKPFKALQALKSQEFRASPKFVELRGLLAETSSTHPCSIGAMDDLAAAIRTFVMTKKPTPAEAWLLPDEPAREGEV